MRTIQQLADVDDPAWPEIEAAIAEAAHPVTRLPADRSQREATLVRLQVTARSALGAVALETGGLLVDHGWLRLLGGGSPPLNLAEAAGGPGAPPSGYLPAGFDVLGGRYVVNGGALPADSGEVCYFAPDELAWVPLGMGYGDFLAWSFTLHFERFNDHLRWPGWEAEVASLRLDQGVGVYPFPFTAEGKDLSRVSRRPTPIAELFPLWESLAAQISSRSDGARINLRIDTGEHRH